MKNNVQITVYTPTYNRKHTLHLCYESLCKQTNKNFKWLIIDDGSTDGTETLVYEWITKGNDFEIEYIYKENGGLHTGYNKAIENMDTELCVCIDSDDYMPDGAIDIILTHWNINKDEKYAGIIGLDYYTNNTLIGERLPEEKDIDLNELMIKGNLVGDKKLIVRTDLYKKVAPMKTFGKEKNFNPNYMNVQISEEYRWLVLNQNLCYVEYLEGGMTNSLYKQFLDSPRSFAQIRRLYLTLNKATKSFLIRNAIHYDSSCILAKRYSEVYTTSPIKWLTVLMFPLGWLLSKYIRFKVK